MSDYILESPDKNAAVKQEINELVENIKLERRKYNEYQILKGVAFECTKEDCGLSRELQNKVYNILMIHDVQQNIGLARGTLLDINFDVYDLTYQEKEKLKEAVQHGLMEKRCTIINELLKIGIDVEAEESSTQTGHALNLTTHEKVLLDLKTQLNEKQELYVKLLQEIIIVFEDFIKLKNQTLPEVAQQKIEECEIQSEVLRLKSEVLRVKARVNVFAETTNALHAYKEILKDILQQQTECKEEIENLQVLKEKYKQVSCKQYEEILKSYLQYKSNIEKKRLFYDRIQRK